MYTEKIALFCRDHGYLGNHKNRDSIIILTFVFIISSIISYLINRQNPSITLGWCMLFFGLLINVIASDMISITRGCFGAGVGGEVGMSITFQYGNEILRIGFACQLLGLILSVINPLKMILSLIDP